MESKTLSPQALHVIEQYFHLPFEGKNVSVPYFNNRKHAVRGALRVMVGKGTPEEIVDETILFGLREKKDLKNFTDEEMKKFLVDHNLGIDCSGLAYHILSAECEAQGKGKIKKYIHFLTKNPLRKLIAELRSVENTGVTVLADNKNSTVVKMSEVSPGDMIIFLNAGRDQKFHHILIIHEIEYTGNKPYILHYTHTLNWRVDGQYQHGIKQGIIKITDPEKNIVEQTWEENGKSGEENETFAHARSAEQVEIRRLRC